MMALMHLRTQNHRRVIICFFRETEDLLLYVHDVLLMPIL